MSGHTTNTPPGRRFLAPPGTRLGWWSLGFLAAHALIMVVLGIVVGFISAAGLPNLAGHPWLIVATLSLAGAPALAGITTGMVAVIWRGERSIAVVTPVLLVVVFLLAEVLVPH